ncbi:MAG TPA: S8 family serine peptidase [Pyrinomonadaceae bacterium]|nr:S8 family serine peptidase [Pyrinomonadaceae bacterium]
MLGKFIKLRSLLIVLVLFIVAAVLLDRTATQPASASGATVSVIVEFKDDAAAVYKAKAAKAGQTVSQEGLEAYRKQLTARQDQFLNNLSASGVTASVVSRSVKGPDGSVAGVVPLRYTLVYNGVALSVPKSAIPVIEAMSQVKKVHPNGLLFTQLNSSVKYIGAPKVYGAVEELSQFDDLREGYEGQGINVAIIDTGVDWTHPMFGGDLTPPRLGVAPPTPALTSTNKKVIYYLPLTDIAANDGFGHGTHVASTVAGYLAMHPGSDGIPGTADDIRLHGVAPQAKIMSYKVCSDIKSSVTSLGVAPLGGCEYSDTIMGIEDSVSPFTVTGQPKPVANVINMSLGGAGGPDSPTAVAASNAALLGTTVVAASGNSGPGDGTTGAPAAGTHVISVGATTHPGGAPLWSVDVLQAGAISPATTGAVTPAKNLPAQSGFDRLKLYPMKGTPPPAANSFAQRYVFINNPLGQWPASVAGRIALVKDPGLASATFADAANQAAAYGAVGMIYFSTSTNPTAGSASIPSANILPEDGEILVDALSSADDNSVDPPSGALSELPVRMNPIFSDKFMGEMGDFSSRGPVRGFGQIKPDVSAPGVAVLAALPPGSLLGGLIGGLEGTPNYGHLDGTSMASPHVAGAVVLIKQAHPDWSSDVVRTALINNATNMRNESGTPKTDAAADSILAQGGGLIDVPGALRTKALMGVEGDGLETPEILGSHSYGEVPVINSRVAHTRQVTVAIRDLSGQGGTYNLRVANNRQLEHSGISVTLSNASVSVPANGSASYTVNATVDGNVIRNTAESIQMQWYVVAERAGGGQTLRMPFYLKPTPTVPASLRSESQTITDTMTGMDYGNEAVAGVTYKEYPVELGASVLTLEGSLDFLEVNESGYNDLDLYLYDPDGNQIAVSGNPGGPEYLKVNITRPGTYTWRVTGFVNVPNTEFTLVTTQGIGTPAPALSSIAGDFTNAQGKAVDFDGSINLNWQAVDGATGYEVERSTDGTNYSVIASPAANQTSLALADQPNGENFYRLRSLSPGKIGSYVTAPSDVRSVVVDRRGKVDITGQVATAMSGVSFTGGVFKVDLNVKNNSASAYVPLVELNVVRISSTSGTVSVKNADNGGNGKGVQTAALYSYSNLLGADQVFSPLEVTGNRSLEFNDPAAEMFSFDVVVTAYQQGSNGAAATGGDGGGGAAAGTSATGGSSPGTSLQSLTKVMRITVNPLTKSVVAKLF